MGIVRSFQSYYSRFFSLPDKSFTWLRNTDSVSEDNQQIDYSIEYTPIHHNSIKFNRILDNSARELYKNTITKLCEIVPKTMAKKIPEANIQQAFIFDTVYRLLPNFKNPKILCVGCYEDTASMSLKRLGVRVEEIDPMINYFLQEYTTKPTAIKSSYDIIFSTSVIEHDPDDESFIKCAYDLLAPGGVLIFTCDFNDAWKPGKLKPDVDARLYTQFDLRERLIRLMPECTFVDEPNWDCKNPDFVFMNKYVYTFASFVVRKKN
jgi:2-polyprenyl-3-methyl-5-hydroxy-6-metoxy-1,4-benzoquinol methylase